MKLNHLDSSIASIAAVLAVELLCGTFASAQDVAAFSVLKSQHLVQTTDAAPALRTIDPFLFEAFVEGSGNGEIFDVQLTKPGSPAAVLLPGDGFFFGLESGFSSLNALNTAYGSGSYRFVFESENDIISIANLNLAGDNYPATPRVSNFAAAQSVNPAMDFTVRWDGFAGGTTENLVELYIYDGQENEVFADSGGLDGTSTSEVVPANTLMSGQTYRGELRIWTIVDVTATDEGALGFAGFYKTTEFGLRTTGGGGIAPLLSNPLRQSNGQFQLRVAGEAGRLYRVEATSTFSSWTTILTTNAPAGGSFDVVDTQAASLSSRFYRVLSP
jgi:hypothetical protein